MASTFKVDFSDNKVQCWNKKSSLNKFDYVSKASCRVSEELSGSNVKKDVYGSFDLIEVVKGISMEQCADKCDQNSECKSFDRRDYGDCFMFRMASTLVNEKPDSVECWNKHVEGAPGAAPAVAVKEDAPASDPANADVTPVGPNREIGGIRCAATAKYSVCIGWEKNKVFCYGNAEGCLWHEHAHQISAGKPDCSTDADCQKYSRSSIKYSDATSYYCDGDKPVAEWKKADDWRADACDAKFKIAPEVEVTRNIVSKLVSCPSQQWNFKIEENPLWKFKADKMNEWCTKIGTKTAKYFDAINWFKAHCQCTN